jgi:lipoate-protein ligase A
MLRVVTDVVGDPRRELATDEAIARLMQEGDPAVLRVYSFSRPAVILGADQHPDDVKHTVRGDAILTMRRTGGGWVYHGTGDLHVSYIAPGRWRESLAIDRIYKHANGRVCAALNDLGIPARVSRHALSLRIDEQHPDGRTLPKKVLGSACRLFPNASLYHATILRDLPVSTLLELSPLPDRPALEAAVREGITAVNVDAGRLSEAVIDAFARHHGGLRREPLRGTEKAAAEKLHADWYANPSRITSGTKRYGCCYLPRDWQLRQMGLGRPDS